MDYSAITLYCVHYDPYRCSCDPESVWRVIQDHGGAAHAAAVGMIDFYVPRQFITHILLLDAGLSVRKGDSYI